MDILWLKTTIIFQNEIKHNKIRQLSAELKHTRGKATEDAQHGPMVGNAYVSKN